MIESGLNSLPLFLRLHPGPTFPTPKIIQENGAGAALDHSPAVCTISGSISPRPRLGKLTSQLPAQLPFLPNPENKQARRDGLVGRPTGLKTSALRRRGGGGAG